jgi:hypothetical protein
VLFLRDPPAELLLERRRAEKEAAELLLCGFAEEGGGVRGTRTAELDSGRGRRTARGGRRQAARTYPTFDFTVQGPDWRRNKSVGGFYKNIIYTRRPSSISLRRE